MEGYQIWHIPYTDMGSGFPPGQEIHLVVSQSEVQCERKGVC